MNEFEITPDLHATGWQRFANFLIDYAARLAIMFAIGIVIGISDYALGTSGTIWLNGLTRFGELGLGLGLLLVYYFVFEFFTARSLAKYITGTIVVTEEGGKPDARTILIRTLCRFIPFDAFTYLSSDAAGWHDTISKTRVVRKKLFDERKNMNLEFDQIGTETEIA